MKILKIRPVISRIIKNLNRLSKKLNRLNSIKIQKILDCIFKSYMLFIRSTSKMKFHKRAENTEMERQGKTKEAGLAKALMGLKIDILIKDIH